MARIGGILFLIITLLCIFGPMLSSYTSSTTELAYGAQAPSAKHWFGTDDLGRDLLIRTLEGGRISIGVGFAATIVALCIGVAYGSIAGYAGRRTESIMMRFVDALFALPFTIIVILLTVFLGRSIFLIFLAIGLVEWLTMARIVRGQTKALRKQNFVEAAIVQGASHTSILIRHILPNMMGPIIVYATLTVPAVMMLESVLSFLGLGVQQPDATWGSLLREARSLQRDNAWIPWFPGLAIT
jgi:oligopeptide transport system permease protein